jgi:hypothetical protein
MYLFIGRCMMVLQLAQALGTSTPRWRRVELGTQRRDDALDLIYGVAVNSSLLVTGEGLLTKLNASGQPR